MKFEYYFTVENGRPPTRISEKIKSILNHYEGKKIRITVEKHAGKRSAKQNNLWHSYISLIAKEIGYEHEELHEIAKYKFLKREKVDETTGEIHTYVASTTGLSKEDFSFLVDSLHKWAGEVFNIILPTPGEHWELENLNDNNGV